MGISEGTQTTDNQFWCPEAPDFQASKTPLNRSILRNCALLAHNLQADYVHGGMSNYRCWQFMRHITKLGHIFNAMGLLIADCRTERKDRHHLFQEDIPHCVKGSTGARGQLFVKKSKNIKIFTRGYNDTDYSMFKSVGLHDWLRAGGCNTIFIVGLDFTKSGVETAKEARQKGYNVVIPMFANLYTDMRSELNVHDIYIKTLIHKHGCKVI